MLAVDVKVVGYDHLRVTSPVEEAITAAALDELPKARKPRKLWAARDSNPARRIKSTQALSVVLTCEYAPP